MLRNDLTVHVSQGYIIVGGVLLFKNNVYSHNNRNINNSQI
jgi:hypothetical protein